MKVILETNNSEIAALAAEACAMRERQASTGVSFHAELQALKHRLFKAALCAKWCVKLVDDK